MNDTGLRVCYSATLMFDWGFSTFEYLPVRQTKASPRGLPDSNTGRHLVLPSLHRGLAPASVVRAKLLATPEVKEEEGIGQGGTLDQRHVGVGPPQSHLLD